MRNVPNPVGRDDASGGFGANPEGFPAGGAPGDWAAPGVDMPGVGATGSAADDAAENGGTASGRAATEAGGWAAPGVNMPGLGAPISDAGDCVGDGGTASSGSVPEAGGWAAPGVGMPSAGDQGSTPGVAVGDGGTASGDAIPDTGGWAAPGLGAPIGEPVERLLSPRVRQLAGLVDGLSVDELVAVQGWVLDRLAERITDQGVMGSFGRMELLEFASALLTAAGRSEIMTGRLAHLADRHRKLSGGVGSTTWLSRKNRLTQGQAAKIVLRAKDTTQMPLLDQAGLTGDANPHQVSAAAQALKQLPQDVLTSAQVSQAEELLVSFAKTIDSAGLAKAGRVLLEHVAPELAQQRDEERAEREYRQAHRNRALWWVDRADGSTLLQATMPTIDAEPLKRLIDAYAEQQRRTTQHNRKADHATDHKADRKTEALAAAVRRMDGLLAVFAEANRHGVAPKLGGDRPRVQVVITYQQLLDKARSAKLFGPRGPGQSIPAGKLRTMLCDADLIPTVLGSKSEILEVGREHRLVTGPIRAALELRDQGCTFPSCDRPVGSTEAHHIKPWYDGGPTDLGNLTLLCPHHHALVEPPRNGPPDWEVRIRPEDQIPEYTPPATLDPRQRPILHQRFTLQGAKPSPVEPTAVKPAAGKPSPLNGEAPAPNDGDNRPDSC
ncbi:MAG: DUF222 domain-containing protein [Bifidobacteriaceae bacterium]|jgi:hypothetical protein|nr:DUF222 domain-containing protein [Bifidobacteriaceae bacterium]